MRARRDGQLSTARSTTARCAAVVALALAWTSVRFFIHDPGPAYLLPIGLAAWWFGPWAGAAAGAASTLLYALSEATQPDGWSPVSVPAATRFLIYVLAGLALGSFAEQLRRERREHRRHLSELRAIQETLTPPLPAGVAEIDFGVAYLPAEHGVSGDFYLIAPGPERSAVVVVGDVVGKGVGASQLAWYVRTTIATAAQFTGDPGDILRLANATVLERPVQDDAFVTIACVVLDLSNRRIRWALAGHPAPVMLDSGRVLASKGASGLPVGIDPASRYPSHEEPLAGGGILLYTDGMSEASPPASGRRDLFGERRIQQLVREHAGCSPGDVVNALRDGALEFADGALPDLCLVAARFEPTPAAPHAVGNGAVARLLPASSGRESHRHAPR